MNKQRNSGSPMSSFDQDFGVQHFEPVEETVVIDGAMVTPLLDRRRPGDPEFAKKHRLLVVDPTGEEWEYPIEGEILIGRAEENHISLPDRAVSRQHLAINTDGQLYWFQDQNSGNGTQVNGEFMKEGWLSGGEELVVGNSHLYFLVPEIDMPPELAAADGAFGAPEEPVLGAAAEQQEPAQEATVAPGTEEPSSGGSLVGLIVLLVGVVGISFVGWWAFSRFAGDKKSGKKIPAITKDSSRPEQEALRFFEECKERMKQQRWSDADKACRKALTLLPSNDSMRTEILQYSSKASKELMAAHFYKRALTLYNQDKPGDALNKIRRIPETSHAFKKGDQLRQRIFKKDIAPEMKFVRVYMESKRVADALKALDKVLSIAPNYQPAKKLKRMLEKGETVLPRSPGLAPSRASATGPYKTLPAALLTGKQSYCQGQYAESIIYFRQQESAGSTGRLRTTAKIFREYVQDFERDLTKGRSLARRRRSASKAIKLLEKARTLDKKHFDGCRSSAYSRTLRRLYRRRARSNFRRKRYRRSAADIRRIRRIRRRRRRRARRRTQTKRLSKALKSEARRLINEAKVLIGIDNNEARKYLRKAMGILPSSDPMYREAKRYLDRAQ